MSFITPDIQLGSRTQSPEAVQAALVTMGYDASGVAVKTDAPPVEETPAEPSAVEPEAPATEDSPASEPDAGGEAAGEGEEVEEQEPEAPADAPPAEEPKKKKSGSARSKEKAARVVEENEELRRRLAEVERQLAGPKEADLTVPDAQAKPTLDQFSDSDDPYLAYQEALVDWKLQEKERTALESQVTARKTKATAEAEAQAKAEQQAMTERWNEQAEIGKSRFSDFDEVMEKAKSIHAAIPLTDALRTSDLMGLLGYHLATNPAELERLNKILDLPANATQETYNRKMRLAYAEVAKLEALVQNAGTETPAEEEQPAETGNAGNEPLKPVIDASREARKTPAPAAKPPVKAKPEPVKPVGSRNGSVRKRLQDMTREQIHAMQQSDPDGFRELVLSSR